MNFAQWQTSLIWKVQDGLSLDVSPWLACLSTETLQERRHGKSIAQLTKDSTSLQAEGAADVTRETTLYPGNSISLYPI